MNTKEQAVLQGLLNKLSAVRVTLTDEEQKLMDWLIQGSHNTAEVEAHMRATRTPDQLANSQPDEVEAHMRAVRTPDQLANSQPDEVEAHMRAIRTPDQLANSQPDEVEAHMRATRTPDQLANSQPEEVQTHRYPLTQTPNSIVLIYNPTMEAYEIE